MENLEILAPAGSKESFIAAIEAGADALYCGLKSFSARSKASNFSFPEFYNYLNYAHSKNVKVYVTLNTLIKQNELKEAIKQINFISQAKADAIIVQDFGIANIVKNHFPQLKLHASTQMSIHNSYGVLEAEKVGFTRIVLARELSLTEISEIKKKTHAEIEIFCHGALCFGISGLCLMSSFIGGYSGNRGACAQPCRRNWSFKDKKGFYLSPKDLDLSAYIQEIKTSGINSLKIEGRMKSPQYVYNSVKAYKLLTSKDLNDKDVIKEAQSLLLMDFARQKTTFNFMKKSKDIFNPEMPKQTGLYAGKIKSFSNGEITIETDININEKDTLKAADAQKDAYFTIPIISVSFLNGVYSIRTSADFLKTGIDIFKTSDEKLEQKIESFIGNAEIKKDIFTAKEKNITYPKFTNTKNTSELFIKIDDAEWMAFINSADKNHKIIFTLTKENLKSSESMNNIDFFDMPSYIDEADLDIFQKTISVLSKQKKKFFLNNISHFGFFKNGQDELYAGMFLYALNSFSADFLLKKNLKNFVFQVENDFKNISEISKQGLAGASIFYISGLPVLAVSAMKMHKDLSQDEHLDSLKDSFQIVHKNGKSIILPQYPVMLFNKKQNLKKLKIEKYLIDLSFIAANKSYLLSILDAFLGKRPLQSDFEFNFERGLK